MLSQAQIKVIKQLHHKKGREKHGLCLVEGEKLVQELADKLLYTFTPEDTVLFQELLTTETPQKIAGVAQIPTSTIKEIAHKPRILILDGVQDPGNVGAILRLCQAFNASLILHESADPTSSKVIRASAGAFFLVPWMKLNTKETDAFLTEAGRPVFRLEKNNEATSYKNLDLSQAILIAGSEGNGINLKTKAPSVFIEHEGALESLNVALAAGIVLAEAYNQA